MTSHYYEKILEPKLNGDILELIRFLQEIGVVKSNVRCSKCKKILNLKKYSRNIHGYALRCMEASCSEYTKYTSVFKNSFFEQFNIHVSKIIKIIFKWSGFTTQREILREVSVSRDTVQKVVYNMRKLCEKFNIQNPIHLGGDGVICQVDESLFRCKPKYHRGRATEHELWVFGIADVSFKPAKIFLKVVESRNANTLLPLIQNVCLPGTTIWSDMWRAYNNIESLNLSHSVVNHQLWFIDKNTGVNTQTIESYWSKAKLRVKIAKGVFGGNLELFLEECMFKDNEMRGDFEKVICLIKNYY